MAEEREARIVAAGETVEVNGSEYKLRPLVAQHLCDLEREALRHYKRRYLQTFVENDDLLRESEGVIERKMEQVARWDLSDLPQKDAFDTSLVPITKKVRQWVDKFAGEKTRTDVGVRALLANALDNGRLEPEELKQMSGRAPLRGRVRYDQWWVTSSMEGMVAFIALSVRSEHPELKKGDIAQWPFPKIAEAAGIVERLTSAAVGNM
jgi:hypothetical protein